MQLFSQRQRDWWEWKREQGFGRYVFYDGVLRFGLMMAVATTIFKQWTDPTGMGAQPLTGAVVVWTVLGALWGAAVWSFSERWLRQRDGNEKGGHPESTLAEAPFFPPSFPPSPGNGSQKPPDAL